MARSRTPLSALVVLGITLCGAGCAANEGSDGVRVTGRLVDAETGEPVSRTRVYVHAFNDATGHQVSLDPTADATTFTLSMPAPEIRLRIADLTHTYELYERDFVAQDGVLHVEVRLVPTHRIRLHGTILWKHADGTLQPLRAGDGNVRHAALSAGRDVGFEPGPDGAYSVMAPRERLEILSINTNYLHAPTEVDLSGETGDDYELDLVLSPGR